MNIKERTLDLVLAAGLFIFVLSVVGIGYVISTPKTVETTVNITQGLPIIDEIVINYGNSINLTEGSTFAVLCNATIVDYNGVGDLSRVNATFFRNNGTEATGYGAYGPENNNSRYENANCTYDSTINSFTFNYNCTFNVTYHAFNGSWNCTVWANNSLNTPTNGTNSSHIYPLYAINVTESVDYGQLSVFDTSDMYTVNVTNFGNMPINLTVYGYGGSDPTEGDGYSFVCPDTSGTNISIEYERWVVSDNTIAWGNMIPLTSSATLMDNVTIQKQSTDSMVWNTTYWRVYIPPNPFGSCNGTIVYEAILGGLQ